MNFNTNRKLLFSRFIHIYIKQAAEHKVMKVKFQIKKRINSKSYQLIWFNTVELSMTENVEISNNFKFYGLKSFPGPAVHKKWVTL